MYEILKNGVKHQGFDNYTDIHNIKLLQYNITKYLFVHTSLKIFLIIDINQGQTLKKEQVIEIFSKEFFINKFSLLS